MADYGFDAGDRGTTKKQTEDDRLRAIFKLRAQTTLIDGQKDSNGRRVATLHQLIDYLTNNKTDNIQRPIGNLMLGSHANEFEVVMPMFIGQQGLTKYETLQECEDDVAGNQSIIMSAELMGPPASPPTHFVNFRGCNIGKSKPFLDKWQEAIAITVAPATNVVVSAPKHFHGTFFSSNWGYWEYMAYEFLVNAPNGGPFASLDAMKSGFRAAAADNPDAFSFVDGNPIPDPYWDDLRWLPNRVKKKRLKDQPTTLQNPISSANDTRTTIGARRGLDVEKTSYIYDITYTTAGAVPDPNNKANCLTILTNTINADPTFAGPFPEYTRHGFADVPSFISGHAWSFSKNSKQLSGQPKQFILKATGIRYIYTLIIPVTDPSPAPDPTVGALVTNFYPLSSFVPGGTLPGPGLVETDTKYFQTSPELT